MNNDLFEALQNYRSQSLKLESLLVYLQGGTDPSTLAELTPDALSLITATSDALNILLVELGGGTPDPEPEPDPEPDPEPEA